MTRRIPVVGGCMAVDDLGAPGAPALLLLHGFTGDRSTWSPLADELANRWRVLVPDLPGHGETTFDDEPTHATMPATTETLAQMLATLGVGTVTVMGYSMGGRLALFAALTAPSVVTGLVLESASAGLANPDERAARRARDERLAAFTEERGIAPFVDVWTEQPLFATQPLALRRRLRAQRLAQRPAGLAASLRGMGTGAQPWLGERLGELRCPVLLLTGADDPRFTRIAGDLARRIPGARHVVIAGAGHAVHLERPEACRQALGAFLEQDGGVECRSSG